MFALPQNLNLTFNRFTTRVDSFLLAYFHTPTELLAFYASGAEIVRNIREVKLALAASYGPVIARLHRAGKSEEVSRTFTMLSRWMSTLGFPLALGVLVFRGELVCIFHSSYTGDTTFMLALSVLPLISVTIGMSANILVMTGHAGWNLVNSVSSGIINVVLSYILVQTHGLLGVALGSAVASLTVTLAILVEVWFLEGVFLRLTKIYKPYIAMILPGSLAVFVESQTWGNNFGHGCWV